MSSNICIGFSLLLLASCIEPYQPDISESRDLIVINGYITDHPGMHYIEISRSSPYDEPRPIPVRNCTVQVEDGNGTAVSYSEFTPGQYRADLDENFLGVNKAYRLYVRTADGEQYLSGYDSLLPGSPPDSLYYAVETREVMNPDILYYGLQFYLDIRGGSNESRNYLWKLEETFEYSSTYLIEYIWDGRILQEFYPAIDSLRTCYRTQPINEYYTASTRLLVVNELNRYPLNYVSNQTVKLKSKYSLLVTQHSLTDEAFLYWQNMKNQLTESGGFYETQPSGSVGNIYNINDDREQVLGYFYAAQVHQKRILVKKSFDFPVRGFQCPLDTAFNEGELGNNFLYLVSLAFFGNGPPYGYGDNACFDCTLRGGTTERPPYWDDDE